LPMKQAADMAVRLNKHVERVPFSGCWIWTGFTKRGYGYVWDGSRISRAHRVSFELFRRKLNPGEVVCHICDVPACVNPEHLFAGTQLDNIRDMERKGRRGRSRCGWFGPAPKGRPKITPDLVREIRVATGTYKKIGDMYGISDQQVSNIKARRYWAYVD
jgi:hypothetical protein